MTFKKHITKSKSGHYTAVVKKEFELGFGTVFKATKLSSAFQANFEADQFIAQAK
jgi:hypothetical protein